MPYTLNTNIRGPAGPEGPMGPEGPEGPPGSGTDVADGSITLAKLASDSVDSSKIVNGSIVNADVNASAAIAYSKLSLATSIVNGDIAAAAAIVYSKLSLAASIVNADIAAGAAIAYSKLNLAASIVNADVAAGAAIALSKLAPGSSGVLKSNGTAITAGNQIVSADITDGTIQSADLAADAATQSGAKIAPTGGISTTSTSAVVMPDDSGGEMAVTLTTTGGPLLAWFTGTLANATAGGVNALGFSLDGAATADLMAYTAPAAGAFGCHTIVYRWAGVAAGSHTVRTLWRVNSGTANAYGRSLIVIELKR